MARTKKLSIALIGSAFILGTAGVAQAAVLTGTNFSTQGGFRDFSTGINMSLAIGPVLRRGYVAEASVFEGTILTAADVGRRITVTQATDPDFDEFVVRLTDGIPSSLILFRGSDPPGRSGGFMSVPFIGEEYLTSSTITSISVLVNQLIIDSPGRNPNGDGIWTDLSYDLTFLVEGEPATPVPEPASTLGLVMIGAGGISLMQKRKQKKPIKSAF